MELKSSSFGYNGMIPAKYTCDGDEMTPPLSFVGAPQGTRSFALTLEDPDAPSGTWDHWIKWNIPPDAEGVSEGTEPQGVSGKGSDGRLRYQGPCPPPGHGPHRYHFKLYALDAMLDLEPEASKKVLELAMEGHILAQAELIGIYSR